MRFVKKFRKNIEYANKYFSDYENHFMLWTPIVKNQGANAKHNQLQDINEIQQIINNEYGVTIESVINHEYAKCLDQLRAYAAKETKELKSPILRLIHIIILFMGHNRSISNPMVSDLPWYEQRLVRFN